MPSSSDTSDDVRVLRVVGIRPEADHVLSYLLADPEDTDLPVWAPGAHVDVHLPAGMVRQYSLCGDPANRRRWRIAVLLEEAGRGGSRYLHERVKVGSTLTVGPPRDNFPLVEASRYLFVAGGIGITPLLPMITTVDRASADWTLHYGARSADRMAFVEELAHYGEPVRLYPEDRCGHLPLDVILGADADGAAVYCCGPESLLRAVERAWPSRVSGSLHVERFHPRHIATEPDRAFEVVLNSTGTVVRVATGQSILAAIAQAGVDVPSSCGEGTCATCETAVLEGEVEHRDSVLTSEEREATRTMMLCVSRARSERLVLDL